MLNVFHDSTTDDEWATYYQFDEDGRVVLTAQPSAVSGYDQETSYLMDEEAHSNPSSPGSLDYLNNSTGLITDYDYYDETNATTGAAEGYLENVKIRHGELRASP